ncbi:MAG: amino acid ABC transporter permease [Propionibacteriaceae bacterium]|jgi:cystine transport system permease protein|nr:amino acid ABC transporter permease [Propionibacteriaceae bacterium]
MSERSWELVRRAFWPLIEATLTTTVPLALCSFAIGLVIALVVALAKLSPTRPVALIGTFYVSLIRGTPLLVQLYIIFYGLPFLGLTLPTFPSAVIALSANVGGYAAEAFRGAILAVPQGQWEAASTIGLGRWNSLRRVVLPQALRLAVPPLSNTFISLVKDTSLCSVVMVTELVRRAQQFATPAYDFLPMYIEAALIYWPICSALSLVQKRLEVRLGRHVSV